jgi:hypothetical protein
MAPSFHEGAEMISAIQAAVHVCVHTVLDVAIRCPGKEAALLVTAMRDDEALVALAGSLMVVSIAPLDEVVQVEALGGARCAKT